MEGDRKPHIELAEVEIHRFSESFETFNRIINNLQRQYLTLENEYGQQSRQLAEINENLRQTIAENRAAMVFLNSVLSSLTSGVIVVDKTGLISHFNPAAEKIVGLAASRALGRTYDQVITAAEGGRYSALDTVMSGMEFEAEEKTIIRLDGTEVPVSVSTALLDEGGEETYGAVEILFDITKIKKLEGEILRVKTLAALGEMAATVAHEVRNPLGGIGGFAALLKREMAADDSRTMLVDKIISGVDTLNRTVSALLDYTRRENLNLREVSLAELVEGSVEYEKADAGALNPGIDLAVEIPDRKLKVTCDPHLMRQVLLNLVRNGRESIIGGGRIIVRAGACECGPGMERDGSAVWIEVADTGQGIPEENRDKIFRPFFSTKAKQNGCGLGLATVWKTVQAHGGDISVRSDVGRGSVFRITLPAAR